MSQDHQVIPGGIRGMRPMAGQGYVANAGPMRSACPAVANSASRGHVVPAAAMSTAGMPRPPNYPASGTQMPDFSPQGQLSAPSPPSSNQSTGSHQPQSHQPQQQEVHNRFDHFARVRMLVTCLKESLAHLVRVASMNIHYMAAVDNGVRLTASDDPPLRFDKALEDFFGICNQIEFSLQTIQEFTMHSKSSQQYLSIAEQNAHQETSTSFKQLVSTVEAQIVSTNEIQQILSQSISQLQVKRAPPPSQFM